MTLGQEDAREIKYEDNSKYEVRSSKAVERGAWWATVVCGEVRE